MWQSAIVSTAKRPNGRHWLSSLHHPARRDGAMALTFFLLPAVIALALERRDHHLDGGTVASLVSVSLGMPVLWLTWAVYRESRRADAGLPGLAEMADELAKAVRTQWDTEVAVRRLNDPFPLPVSWVAADAFLTDSRDSLVELARNGCSAWR